jgi:hypothetical protein
MNTRGALALAALLAASAGDAAGQSEPRVSFAAGNWRGEAYFAGAAFSHCQIRVRFLDGGILGMSMRAGGAMSLGLGKVDWSMDPAADYSGVRFEIDPGFQKTYPGRVDPARRSEIWFTAGNDPELRRALAQGRTLTYVDAAGKRWAFSLERGAAAVRKLTACVLLFTPD